MVRREALGDGLVRAPGREPASAARKGVAGFRGCRVERDAPAGYVRSLIEPYVQFSRIRLSVWKFVFIAPVPRTFSESFHFGHDGIVQLGQAVCGSPHHLRIAPFDSPFGQYISYPHVLCLPFHAEALHSTGIAPLPRYYDLIRLLHSLSLIAVLPSSLAELSGSAAPFAPPRPPCPNRVSKVMLASRPQRR